MEPNSLFILFIYKDPYYLYPKTELLSVGSTYCGDLHTNNKHLKHTLQYQYLTFKTYITLQVSKVKIHKNNDHTILHYKYNKMYLVVMQFSFCHDIKR